MNGLADPCLADPSYCRNGGSCVFSNTVTCSCLAGWTGPKCEEEDVPDPCLEVECPQYSQCSAVDGQAVCACLQGYTGRKITTQWQLWHMSSIHL